MLAIVLSALLCDSAEALRQLTSHPGAAVNPDWSPDGSQIAFVRWEPGSAENALYLVDASGGTPLPVPLPEALRTSWPAWSPNGEYIAATTSLDEDHNAIQVIVVSDGARWGLVGGGREYRSPTWSPDGGWIAFDRYYNHASEIAVVPSIGGRPEWILSDASFPAWSPDSTMIAFIRSWNIWLASPTGEDQRQLTTLSGVRGPLSWSPNSRYIAFDSDHSGNQDIWMVPISGGEPTQLTTYPGWDADPTWSPRGDEIAFSSSRAGKSGLDIWALEVPPTPTESTSWGKLKTLLR
jgi:Tol biopolymer transport system component